MGIPPKSSGADDSMPIGARRRRILFVAEAVTLAHVARAHSLAQSLDSRQFDITVAADPRYAGLFADRSYASQAIGTIPADRFAKAIEKGAPIYDVETLDSYVKDDLRVIEAFDPDVIIGDFRLSLTVSARLARTPYVTITNAGWSPYAKIGFTVPDLPITRWLGERTAQRMFDAARTIAFAVHARPINRLRRRHGLPRLPSDIRFAYTDADFILYADLPEMFSMRTTPDSHAFLGPVEWSPAGGLPDWWRRLPTDRPLIYVTLGSSGRSGVLPALLAALGDMPVAVVVATAGRIELDDQPSNVHIADFLPGATAAARADLVICNGGSPTCYQAFAAGRPVLGIPTNLDQFLNMRAVVHSGAGRMLRPGSIEKTRVRRIVDEMLGDTAQRRHAGRLQDACRRTSAPKILTGTLRAATSAPAGKP